MLLAGKEMGVAGAEPMRGESEGCPLSTSSLLFLAAKRRAPAFMSAYSGGIMLRATADG